MQLLRVRDNGKHRDVTYRKRYPTWDLKVNNNIWESFEPLPIHYLVPLAVPIKAVQAPFVEKDVCS